MHSKQDTNTHLKTLFDELFSDDPFVNLELIQSMLEEASPQEICTMTYFVVQKHNTKALDELIKAYNHPHACLIHASLSLILLGQNDENCSLHHLNLDCVTLLCEHLVFLFELANPAPKRDFHNLAK